MYSRYIFVQKIVMLSFLWFFTFISTYPSLRTLNYSCLLLLIFVFERRSGFAERMIYKMEVLLSLPQTTQCLVNCLKFCYRTISISTKWVIIRHHFKALRFDSYHVKTSMDVINWCWFIYLFCFLSCYYWILLRWLGLMVDGGFHFPENILSANEY